MPPGKALTPALRRKVDELFLRWLSDPGTQRALHDELHRIQAAGDAGSRAAAAGDAGSRAAAAGDAGSSAGSSARDAGNIAAAAGDAGSSARSSAGDAGSGAAAAGDAGSRTGSGVAAAGDAGTPDLPCMLPLGAWGPRAARATVARRTSGARKAPSPQAQPPPARPPGRSVPAFFFPRGRPPQAAVDVDAAIARVEHVFSRFPHERAAQGDMGQVAKACGCPLYWKGPLFYAAGGERTGSVSVHKFVAMWRKVLLTCHDDAAKFVQLLATPGSDGLGQEDLVPLLQDVVNSHPGLSFLKEASEFHSRYITTVIQRIFYAVNRSWSGKITCEELRRSSFLQNVSLLEVEADINQLPEFFSYEHFYVIYCKFWELDTDHDLAIDARDLARHSDHAISSRMIDRIFSGAVTRGRMSRKDGKMSYADFVWFLISEEDKTTPTSIEYWFRCMDLDGDGVLSMFELEFFYEEQAQRLDARAVEPLPFRDCVCQMLDLVTPRVPGKITLWDLKRCKMAGAFFDTFFNVDKYLEREQREQASLPREPAGEGPALTDWEKYAAEEYDFLVAEEEAAGEPWDDGLAPDPAQKLFESPLGAVELYEFVEDDEDEEEDADDL